MNKTVTALTKLSLSKENRHFSFLNGAIPYSVGTSRMMTSQPSHHATSVEAVKVKLGHTVAAPHFQHFQLRSGSGCHALSFELNRLNSV